MFQLSSVVLASVLSLAVCCVAQQFAPPVSYDSVLSSPINPNITISYKSPRPGTCVTAFNTQKQYSGYVHLPPSTLAPYQQNYSINTFFWFIEARTNPETAPLTIWLNGGPGSSSMIGLFRESGPCEVVQANDGSYGTQPNMWGWDRSSNVLFIDQPTQTGFSYDEAVNGSLNLSNNQLFPTPQSLPEGFPAWSLLNGTFSSGHEYSTQNTSVIAASASWHFLQGFLSAFPKYNPGIRPGSNTTEPTGVNLFAESYGGLYGPAFANYFEAQNAKRIIGDLPRNSTLEIKLTSLGIINGLVDQLIQTPSLPKFAYNNTYGIQAIDQTTQLNALSDFSASGGCRDLITQCRDSMTANDPHGEGDDAATNKICERANEACNDILVTAGSSDRNVYDIRVLNPSSFPNYAYLEYLNNADVLRSIGARVNFTETSSGVFNAFGQTGDVIRGTQMTSLASLLSLGVRVAFIYGDADLICNWYGGEAVSLELARHLSTYSTAFPAAGYADIITNNTYVGGQVRQYGNLSFSRIYDAGHTVPSYQPETAFTVFTRIIEGNDIGTGKDINMSTFATKGPNFSTYRNKVPEQPKSTCWVRALETCSQDDQQEMHQGNGIVKFGVWVAQESDLPVPESHSIIGKPGSLPTNFPSQSSTTTSSLPLTGVYTATGTPTPTSGASSNRFSFRIQPRNLVEAPSWETLGHLWAGTPGDSYWDSDHKRDNEDRKRRKKRLGMGLGIGLGGLVFLILLASLVACLMRRRRAPKAAPVTKIAGTDPQPKKPRYVQRFTRQPSKTASTPVLPIDIERVETPPPFPDDRRPIPRRHTLPMEPIPEQDHLAGPPQPVVVDEPRRLSTHPNEPIILEEPSQRRAPFVQRSVDYPSRQPTQTIPEPAGPPARQDPQAIPKPPTWKPNSAVEEPTPIVDRKATEIPIEPARPVQRAASLPLEGSPSRKNIESAQAPAPAPEPGPEEQPGLLNRIRDTWRHSLGSSEAAPTVIQELKDQERVPSLPPPPPRAATMPVPPPKAPTVKISEPVPAPPTKAPTAKVV